MTNIEISEVLYRVAELLELTDVSRFEIIAYQNAARTVEFLQEDLNKIYSEGGLEALQDISGIGKTISHNIAELIDKGKLSKMEMLLEKIPKMEIEINKIPGVGPKTTKKIYEALKPNSLPEFIKQLKSGDSRAKLAKLSIKDKTIDNILRGISVQKELSQRTPIAVALPIAEHFLNIIKNSPGVKQAHIVGSLRRMKDTVGDIDIIASVKDPQPVINNFITDPAVTHVVGKGIKTTILTKNKIQVDLEILPQEEYGSLLQHFTGSKEHNVMLRTQSLTQGLSVSEHGITPIKKSEAKGENVKGKIIKCSTEEKVYKTLGMDWIPPELREGRGEIALALKHDLPKLIELKDIKGDLQMHSVASDGKTAILDMALAASSKGYQYIAITDHSFGNGVTGGLDEKTIITQNKKIDNVNKELKKKNLKLKVLKSIEVNVRANGDLDLSDKALKTLDLVVASIHSSFSQSREVVTARYLKVINNPNVHIIAHPTGRLIGSRPELNVDWPIIFEACKKTGTALEINSSLERLDLPDRLAIEAGKLGVKIVISTDAHSPEGLENMRFGVAQARRSWLTKRQILNTLNIDDFLKSLKNK
jgi:DNA polymerase (family 10)